MSNKLPIRKSVQLDFDAYLSAQVREAASVQAKLVKLSADMKIKLPHHWDRPAPADVTLPSKPIKRAAAKPVRKGKARK